MAFKAILYERCENHCYTLTVAMSVNRFSNNPGPEVYNASYSLEHKLTQFDGDLMINLDQEALLQCSVEILTRKLLTLEGKRTLFQLTS